MSVIPPHMEWVPLWRTHGVYRKEIRRRFPERVYHQRAKDETIFSVVKRTMGDEMRSVRTKGLNNEIRVRMIAYNAMRVASSLVRGFLQSLEIVANLYSARWTRVGMMKVGGVQFGMADDAQNRTHPFRGVGPIGPASLWVYNHRFLKSKGALFLDDRKVEASQARVPLQ